MKTKKEVEMIGRAKAWKEFRKQHLFTQKRLAEVLGISVKTVKNVEGAVHVPHYETLAKMKVLVAKHG